jgi:hypothetical protein
MAKRKVRRFTVERRAAFLVHLRRTGNQEGAARALGFDRTVPEQRRKRDAAFELECRAAQAEANARLAGATDAFDHDGDPRFEMIRRGRGGRLQIVATRAGKWSKRNEELFLELLRGCGNVAAAARGVGFSESLIWQRRRKWADFERRMEAALEEAEMVLEFRLATLGTDKSAIWQDCDTADATDAAAGPAVGAAEAPSAPVRFDPEFALRFLKWREDKRRGRSPCAGRAGQATHTLEDHRQSILRKIDAIVSHDEKIQLAQGWTRDEEGRMIPPGWARVAGPGEALGPGEEADP